MSCDRFFSADSQDCLLYSGTELIIIEYICFQVVDNKLKATFGGTPLHAVVASLTPVVLCSACCPRPERPTD